VSLVPTGRAEAWENPSSTHPAPSRDPRPAADNHISPRNSSSAAPPQEDELATAAIAEGRRIYVGNLVYYAKPSDVTSHFTSAGYAISRISMSIDPFTGRNPSYCFVEFDSKDAADDAMQKLDGTTILSRTIKVRPCVPKSQAPPKRGRWAPSHLAPDSSLNRWTRTDTPEHWHGVSQEKRRLYVGGLPKPVSQTQSELLIRDLFAGFELQAISKVISPHDGKKNEPGNHYYAFVDFETAGKAAGAQRAINGAMFEGTKLRVQFAKGDSRKVDERGIVGLVKGEEEDEGVGAVGM
jgi:RNA recognition motif-containing protein